MKFEKNYVVIAVAILLVFVTNFTSTLNIFLAVRYPEREIREVITDFFKNNLNKAVKCNQIYIDYSGEIIVSDLDISISSDFNDNISLVKSSKAVINLSFFELLGGKIEIKGLKFYNSEIIFPKKYGRSYIDSFYQILDVSTFLQRVRENFKTLQIDFKRATLYYKESLRDKQVLVELYKIDAAVSIENNLFSYRVDGYMKPLKTDSIRRGTFYAKGNFDMQRVNNWSHQIQIDNFDLSYLNNYIIEYKLSDISLSGGLSCDLAIAIKGDTQTVKGQVETNGLTVTDLVKKFNIISNENLDAELELKRDTELNSYTFAKLNLRDNVFSINASGGYVNNQKDEKLDFQYKTNRIDLSDLAEVFTPYNNMIYSGTLVSNGKFFLDFRNNRATGSKLEAGINKFSLANNEKGNRKTIIGESNVKLTLTESEIALNVAINPMNSDLVLASNTRISSWVPFKSDSRASLTSKKLNSEILFHSIKFLLKKLMTSAYENKKISDDSVPFLQRPAGKFLNSNNLNLKCRFDAIFFGKSSTLKNLTCEFQLHKGVLALKDVAAQGFDADYKMAAQAFFNSDQPYFKLDGRINNLNIADFYSGTGVNGYMSGTANIDYRYELSANRISDILENSKGSLNIYVTNGVLKNTPPQKILVKFLHKNGYSTFAINRVDFQTINISVSQQGENFWITNFGIKGDALSFAAIGSYTFNGGISSQFGMKVKYEEATAILPVQLSGPLLAPCIDLYNKKGSQNACF